MKPRYWQNAGEGNTQSHRWMISYLDVLTILLVFFIGVAARALQPVPPKPAPPRPERAPVVQVSSALDGVQRQLAQRGLDLRREPRGLVISLPQTILFPSGDERIQHSALPVVAEIAEVLRGIPNPINLAGNADSVPIHNHHFHNNWELSAARGMALLDLLASRYGIAESRLSVTNYGSYRPRDSNDTPDGRAGNRRVEIVILDETSDSRSPQVRAP